MRPRTIDEVVGHDDLIAAGRPLRRAIDSGAMSSMIFWGPPGSGKTTLARAIAGASQGVMQVAIAAPQNQARRVKRHDQYDHDHQQ